MNFSPLPVAVTRRKGGGGGGLVTWRFLCRLRSLAPRLRSFFPHSFLLLLLLSEAPRGNVASSHSSPSGRPPSPPCSFVPGQAAAAVGAGLLKFPPGRVFSLTFGPGWFLCVQGPLRCFAVCGKLLAAVTLTVNTAASLCCPLSLVV